MLFLFKYIDDLVGKGFEWYVILELMFYASASQVSMALPLSILLSSIMTFGNLGESYELVALKSAGVSLQKIMFPLMILVAFIAFGAFLFSNYMLPKANLKMGSLLYDVRNQRPAFLIKDGIFYNGIDGYSIRVARKDKDGATLHDVMIYDQTAGNGNINVLLAKTGVMMTSENESTLGLKLFDGIRYEEVNSNGYAQRKEHTRIKFKEYELKLDLSGFQLSRTNEDLFKNNYQMLNVKQLQNAQDSLSLNLTSKTEQLNTSIKNYFSIYSRSGWANSEIERSIAFKKDVFLLNFTDSLQRIVREASLSNMRNILTIATASKEERMTTEKLNWRHAIEFHRKFTLSVACLVLFFIGAPLGAIIRKGGLGMPMLVSILFFLVFHIFSVIGEKSGKEGALPVFVGMWLATFVLTPLGIFLTSKAARDSVLFDLSSYLKFFKKFRSEKLVKS